MNVSEFEILIERYIAGNCTTEEMKLLQDVLQRSEYVSILEKLMDRQLEEGVSTKEDNSFDTERIKNLLTTRIENEQRSLKKSPVVWIRRLSVAAAIIIITFSIIFFQFSSKQPVKGDKVIAVFPDLKNDIAPGKEGAVLTLGDGRTVVLDSLGNGFITDEFGAKVILTDGQLAYQAKARNDGEVVYNMITTPKGRQFRLLLQDGTRVWLNAASSIRYPAVFTGTERKVEITGEAYFEVAKNEKIPFHVIVNKETDIEVLGTHFNINSYLNESSINTTLLEGSVKISKGNKKVIIKPGQQAQTSGIRQDDIKILSNINLEKIVAWKNGVFDFQDASLQEVMRQLERWYDIEVVYEKGIPELEFIGKMGRDLTLSEVLRGLEMAEVHFKIEDGRKLIVRP